MLDDAAMLLRDARQEPGNVLECHERMLNASQNLMKRRGP